MIAFRALVRAAVGAALCAFVVCAYSLPAYARARLIAVVIFRSTAASHHDAVLASKSLAAVLAQEPGWDAKAINAGGKSPADAAAAAGAEIYVIGQYVPGKPARVTGASFRVATDERLGDFSFALSDGRTVPSSVSFAEITATAVPKAVVAQVTPAPQPTSVAIPSGDLISVMILKDIGSRISQEGDTFAVETVEDYYYKGQLILPKGSPGYGVITHLKRAGSFHAGGELNFTVKRLVTPSKTDVLVETNGATADADKTTEHNGNAFGQYLLWGVGMFAKRGNDILIKKGTTFHVSTLQNDNVPVTSENAQPAAFDPGYTVSNDPQLSTAPQSAPAQLAKPADIGEIYEPQPQPSATATRAVVPPSHWIEKQAKSTNDVATLGYWVAPSSSYETFQVVTQSIPGSMLPSQYADMTMRSLENAIGAKNVRAFRTEQICNGRANGWYIESSVTSGATSVITEQTLGVTSGASYIATYRRPANSPEDTAARQALDTLCPQAA